MVPISHVFERKTPISFNIFPLATTTVLSDGQARDPLAAATVEI
jgi:hypothetical protein